MRPEATWTQPREECPEPERWHAPDELATEAEVTSLLVGLCLALRPHRVLETGTYNGDTAEAMGRALKGYGYLDSLEIDKERAAAAAERVRGLPVTIHAISSLEFSGDAYDFMFFDSAPGLRGEEMKRFYRKGAIWAVHDTKWEVNRAGIEAMEAVGLINGRVELPTPRGITIGRFA